MAFNFPLTAGQFFEDLPVEGIRCWFNEPRSSSRLAGGEVLSFSVGSTLWRGDVLLSPDYHIEQAAVEAMLGLASMVGASFLAFDTRYNGPRRDPGGELLSGHSPVIASRDANNREFTLSGLPPDYVLSRGDLIGWLYNGDYAVHRIVTGRIANASGVTGKIEVVPHIEGLSNGTPVNLVQPVFKAVLTKGVAYGMGSPVITAGSSISFVQTLGG